MLKRGKAPVDPVSPHTSKCSLCVDSEWFGITRALETHVVYSDSQDVWDAMLNQTEVGSNKNKCVAFMYYARYR